MYKTEVSITVLSSFKPDIRTLAELSDIVTECDNGECSGSFHVSQIKELSKVEMANELEKQGSDADFFGIDFVRATIVLNDGDFPCPPTKYTFDVIPWLRTSTDAELIKLVSSKFIGDIGGEISEYISVLDRNLYKVIEKERKSNCGYTIAIEEKEAIAWIQDNRNDVYSVLSAEKLV